MKKMIAVIGLTFLAVSAAAEVQIHTTGSGRRIAVRTAHFEKSIAPSPADVARRPYGLLWESEKREWDKAHAQDKINEGAKSK